MPKITSVDALIERAEVAYPKSERIGFLIRELMEEKRYNAVYDMLRHGERHPGHRDFSAKKILSAVDKDGRPIEEVFSKLIAEARGIVEEKALKPLRRQLADDFKETYPEAQLLDY